MKRVVESARSNFPDLELCEIGQIGARSTYDQLRQKSQNTEVHEWLDWFANETIPFDLFRVRLTTGELLFKQLSGAYFLVLYHKSGNVPLLLQFLNELGKDYRQVYVLPDQPEVSEPIHTARTEDPRLQNAVRIQRMIIPKEQEIKKHFKDFFVVHEQQDVVGGDFYWMKTQGACVAMGLIDCTGHSVEGAMTSMICSSLLNEAFADFNGDSLPQRMEQFYTALNNYNLQSADGGYGVGAEVGIFCFDRERDVVHFTSTGISAFVKMKNGSLELLRMRKVISYENIDRYIATNTIRLSEMEGLYAFTDGLTDQFDATDRKKLGYKGLQYMIEHEGTFDSAYYGQQIRKWRGENFQYDDITLMGIAI